MSKEPLVLTFDFGTQSVRAALINKKGDIEAIVKKQYSPAPYFSKEKGFAEQRPDFYYEHLIEAVKELTKNNADKLDRIIGSTIACFRDSSVQLDQDNKPVRDCVLWLDQRMAKASEKIPALYSFLFKVVGMDETIKLNRSRTVAHWIKENEPDVWSKTKKYVNISTYLTYKITGQLVDSCANLTGHYPINFKARKWDGDKALKGCIFGIPYNETTFAASFQFELEYDLSDITELEDSTPVTTFNKSFGDVSRLKTFTDYPDYMTFYPLKIKGWKVKPTK